MTQPDRVKHLHALSNQSRDEGCYVEAAWLKFYAKAPHDLTPRGYEFSRLMFFAGAISIFDTMKGLASHVELTQGDIDFLRSIDVELHQHLDQELMEQPQGNA